jgi:hypothetical protein
MPAGARTTHSAGLSGEKFERYLIHVFFAGIGSE